MKQGSVPPSGKATVDALADKWGKLLSIYMLMMKVDHIVITTKDIDAVGKDGNLEKCLVVQELEDGLHIRLLSVDEAVAMAKQNKTGFGRS